MKRKLSESILLTAALLATAYVGSYVLIRVLRPEAINTHDGPIASYCAFYRPLRFLEASKPEWYATAAIHGGWLDAKIDWFNGNGWLYFTWAGSELRACAPDDMTGWLAGDSVRLHFAYQLETWDDFTSRLVPYIDRIERP